MRKNRAPKGSIPIVCYNTNTKSYLGLDAEHPLMDEDWIKVIGSRADFDMNGESLNKPKPAHKPAKVKAKEPEVDLGGAEVVGDDDDEIEDEVGEPTPEEETPKELGYEELKEALIKLGIEFKGNAKKSDLVIMYDEAVHKE